MKKSATEKKKMLRKTVVVHNYSTNIAKHSQVLKKHASSKIYTLHTLGGMKELYGLQCLGLRTLGPSTIYSNVRTVLFRMKIEKGKVDIKLNFTVQFFCD